MPSSFTSRTVRGGGSSLFPVKDDEPPMLCFHFKYFSPAQLTPSIRDESGTKVFEMMEHEKVGTGSAPFICTHLLLETVALLSILYMNGADGGGIQRNLSQAYPWMGPSGPRLLGILDTAISPTQVFFRQRDST